MKTKAAKLKAKFVLIRQVSQAKGFDETVLAKSVSFQSKEQDDCYAEADALMGADVRELRSNHVGSDAGYIDMIVISSGMRVEDQQEGTIIRYYVMTKEQAAEYLAD